MPKRSTAEGDLQIAIMDAAQALLKPPAFGYWVSNLPSTNATSPFARMLAARKGLLAGLPDLVWHWNTDGNFFKYNTTSPREFTGDWRVGFMEVKAPGGKLSARQKEMFSFLNSRFLPCVVVRSVDDAVDAWAAWGIPMRAHILGKSNANP